MVSRGVFPVFVAVLAMVLVACSPAPSPSPTAAPAAAPKPAATAAPAAAATAAATPQPAAAKPASIQLLLPSGTTSKAIQEEFIPNWEKATGVKVNATYLPLDEVRTKLNTQIVSGQVEFDMAMIIPGWVGTFAANLTDLGPMIKNPAIVPQGYDWDADFSDGAKGLGIMNGVQVALPYTVVTHVLHYRKDVFDALGLKPPKSYAELRDLAMKLTVAGKSAQPSYAGMGMWAAQGTTATESVIHLWRSSGIKDLYSDDYKQIFIDTPEAVSTLQWWADLINKDKATPQEVITWGSTADLVTAGQQGRAAMLMSTELLRAQFDDPNQSKTAGKWSTAAMPGKNGEQDRVGWVGGWVFAVPKKAPNPEWGARIGMFMTDKAAIKRAAMDGRFPPRKSTLQDPEVKAKLPWADAASLGIAKALPSPRDPLWGSLQPPLDAAISSVLTGKATAQQALSQAAAEWRDILKKAGKGQ